MHLPVAYLSDEKKGEVISKISNDVQEIEWSIQSAIKGVFKEPINILVFLGSLLLQETKNIMSSAKIRCLITSLNLFQLLEFHCIQ